jgi:hypothetical protein
MRCRAIIVIGCVALAGCAPRAWTRTGATQADYNKDSYSCERDVQQAEHLGGGNRGRLTHATCTHTVCRRQAGQKRRVTRDLKR